jgi:hypothetical protein
LREIPRLDWTPSQPCDDTPCDAAGYAIYFWEDGTPAPLSTESARADENIFRFIHGSTTPGVPLSALGVPIGKKYYYAVSAYNDSGESAMCDPIEYTIPTYDPGISKLPTADDSFVLTLPQGTQLMLKFTKVE